MEQSIASPDRAGTPTPAAVAHRPRRGEDILSLIRGQWPGEVPCRTRAGLPVLALAALGLGGPKGKLRRVAGGLDTTAPGWMELTAAAACRFASRPHGGAGMPCASLPEEMTLACALLGLRPLSHPEMLVTALASARLSDETRFWLLVALAGTDTAAVRQAWRREIDRWSVARPHNTEGGEGTGAGSPCWLAFVRSLLGGWLGWEEFRECVAVGRVLDHAAGRAQAGYRPALESVGLWRNPRFAKWYRQAVYEAAHQPDVALSFATGGWIRDFPGEDYLWEALAMVEARPDDWWPLYLVRWVSNVEVTSDEVQSQLARFSSRTLCLLSLLRPEFGEAVGSMLRSPFHGAVVKWLRGARPGEGLDLAWLEETVAPWAASTAEAFVDSVGALCSLMPPPDYRADVGETVRRRAFLREHLLPEMHQVMDNLFHVYAVEKRHFPLTLEQARKGRPAAARALALWPERAQESGPVLLDLVRDGGGPIREAAREALDVLADRAGFAGVGEVERRVDLSFAWSDGGLEGRSARVWWDIAGYRVRLAVAAGEVRVQVYSHERPLATIPSKVRQHGNWHEVCESRERLADSYRHFRRRFEQAMVEEATWSGRDFALLLASPVVRSLVAGLVLLADGEPVWRAQLEPAAEPGALAGIERTRRIGVAHPVGLLRSGSLEAWQERVIRERVGQPFKQVFREVYLPAQGEGAEASCYRFAGHPLEARQAFALLRQRGYAPKRGEAVKEWRGQGLRAHLRWAASDEPVGKLLGRATKSVPVTSGAIWFEGERGEQLSVSAVPPVVFSETLRDADLLVSRAAAGELGFTSEETRRLRRALVRHVARALGLTSVYASEDSAHVIVEGTLATYRVHLGSGSVLLEKSRRSLDVSGIEGPGTDVVGAESLDAHTSRIIGTVIALCQDDQIAAPGFREQLASLAGQAVQEAGGGGGNSTIVPAPGASHRGLPARGDGA